MAVTESERKRIPYLGSREAKATSSFEGGDAKRSIVRRRRQRPSRDTDVDEFSQVVIRASAKDRV